jgi:hypothetical protein
MKDSQNFGSPGQNVRNGCSTLAMDDAINSNMTDDEAMFETPRVRGDGGLQPFSTREEPSTPRQILETGLTSFAQK